MDPARYIARSTVTVKNINKLGFWEAPINLVKINGKSTGWTNRTGILDTELYVHSSSTKLTADYLLVLALAGLI
jgi:hypothetical protein